MERQTVAMIRSGVLAVGISLFLYQLAASSMLFVVPLLFFAPQFPSPRWALIPVAVVWVLIVGVQLAGLGGYLRDVSVFTALLVGFYFPVSLLVGAAIWIMLQQRRLFARLVSASSFAALFGMVLVWWLSGDSASAQATATVYRDLVEVMVVPLFGEQLPLGMTAEVLFQTVVSLVRIGFFPLFLGQFGFSAYISELMIHRRDESYQIRMSHWRLPDNAVWVFLGSWMVVLITLIVDIPLLASFAWNAALACSLLYMVQGMAILAFLVRKRNPGANVSRIFFLAFLLVMLPGVNVVFVLGLPILGVSETWVGYRKFA